MNKHAMTRHASLSALFFPRSSLAPHCLWLDNHNKATKIAYLASAVQLSTAHGILDFQHSIRKAEQRGDDLRSPLMSAVYANGLRTANLFFMAYGTLDFQHSIRTAARKRRQLTTVRANCL